MSTLTTTHDFSGHPELFRRPDDIAGVTHRRTLAVHSGTRAIRQGVSWYIFLDGQRRPALERATTATEPVPSNGAAVVDAEEREAGRCGVARTRRLGLGRASSCTKANSVTAADG